MRKGYIAYVALAAAVCLVPSLGLLAVGPSEASDSDAAPVPRLVADDGFPNLNMLADAGAWFDDHFALRDACVTAADAVGEHVFGTSVNDGVVVGEDGWLYYGDSLDDYQGRETLSERQLFTIARNMRIAQDWVEAQGGAFALGIAPDKATLYGEHMPYYYQAPKLGKGNLARLEPYLMRLGVNHVNLAALLSAHEGTLYHERDSHWNGYGAALAADALLDVLDVGHGAYASRAFVPRADYTGDLDRMLYPAAPAELDELYCDPAPQFAYDDAVDSNFAPKISTTADAAGSAVVYRDSFGNALLPYLAGSFGSAYFSRGVPYRMHLDVPEHGANAVIVERAERFLPDMAANAPLVPAPEVGGSVREERTVAVQDAAEKASGEGWVLVSGTVPDGFGLQTASRVCVRVNGKAAYEACSFSADDGVEHWQALLAAGALEDDGNEYELFTN